MEHPDLTLAFTLTIRAPQCGLFGEHIAEKAARLLFCFFPFLAGLHVLMAERQMLWLGEYILYLIRIIRVKIMSRIIILLIIPIVMKKNTTSSTAQGGGGSFKNRKPIGEVGCCESGMAERSHWWTERCLISLTLSISFSDYIYLPTYLFSMYLSIYRSIYLSLSFI